MFIDSSSKVYSLSMCETQKQVLEKLKCNVPKELIRLIKKGSRIVKKKSLFEWNRDLSKKKITDFILTSDYYIEYCSDIFINPKKYKRLKILNCLYQSEYCNRSIHPSAYNKNEENQRNFKKNIKGFPHNLKIIYLKTNFFDKLISKFPKKIKKLSLTHYSDGLIFPSKLKILKLYDRAVRNIIFLNVESAISLKKIVLGGSDFPIHHPRENDKIILPPKLEILKIEKKDCFQFIKIFPKTLKKLIIPKNELGKYKNLIVNHPKMKIKLIS